MPSKHTGAAKRMTGGLTLVAASKTEENEQQVRKGHGSTAWPSKYALSKQQQGVRAY